MRRTRGGAPAPHDRPATTIEWIEPLDDPDATKRRDRRGRHRPPAADARVRMHFVRGGRPLALVSLWAVTGVVGVFVALALAQSRPPEQTARPVPPAPVTTTSVVAGTPQAPRRPTGHAAERGSDGADRRDGHHGAPTTTTLGPLPNGAARDPGIAADESIDEVRGPRPGTA